MNIFWDQGIHISSKKVEFILWRLSKNCTKQCKYMKKRVNQILWTNFFPVLKMNIFLDQGIAISSKKLEVKLWRLSKNSTKQCKYKKKSVN